VKDLRFSHRTAFFDETPTSLKGIIYWHPRCYQAGVVI
jgi:hypothetical protein